MSALIQEIPRRKHCPNQTQLGQPLHHIKAPHLGLLRCDAMNSKPALGIIHQAEMLTCLLNADDI